jgi:putative phosphoesterase
LCPMRLAIISDTHMPRGARRLPGACVAELERADAILHCGDLARVEVLDALEAYGPPVHAICGNVDDAAVRARLPARLDIELAGARIGMVHDPGPRRGRLDRLRAWFPRAHAVLFGHTHLPEHEQRDGFQIFNPGSPTERRRAPAHTMGIGTVADGAVAFALKVVT